ncbi:MAG: hypothetical protein JNJ94_07730 [Chlorobi bacterium]|nr:hypothetical protein [Chlorobiota bacterium]
MAIAANLLVQARADSRGVIRCGTTKSGKDKHGKERELPQKLDYWNIEPFPELIEVYGTKPKTLYGYLTSPDILAVISAEYQRWGGGVKTRACDRQHCVHRVASTIAGVSYGVGEISDCLCDGPLRDTSSKCMMNCTLDLKIVHPQTGRLVQALPYRFRTHSEHNAQALLSVLVPLEDFDLEEHGESQLHKQLFALSVRMVSRKSDANTKYPRWAISRAQIVLPAFADNQPNGQPHSQRTATPSAPPTAANGVGADGNASGIAQPHSQRAAQANAAAGDSLRQPLQPTSPLSSPTATPVATSVAANGSENPPPPHIPAAELTDYEQVGQELFGNQWQEKRTAHIRNRTECLSATRMMKLILRKRQLELTRAEWEEILKKARVVKLDQATSSEFNRVSSMLEKIAGNLQESV